MVEKIQQDFEFFNVDKTQLDIEWANQPKIFHKYAVELANTKRRLEESKTESDIVKAELDLLIRKSPQKYGFEKDTKTTEAMILATITIQPKYQEALKQITIKKHRVDILQATVSALDHRKAALENEVKLFGMDYFSIPKVSDESSKKIVEDIEDSNMKRRVQQSTLQGKKRSKK